MGNNKLFDIALLCSVAALFFLMGYHHDKPISQVMKTISYVDRGYTESSGVPDSVRAYYEKQVPERINFIKGMQAGNARLFYTVMGPEVFCPYIVRVGTVNDGGKKVCNVNLIPKKDCAIYSLGIAGDISFERDVQFFSNNGCRVYGYDQNKQNEQVLSSYKRINGTMEAVYISAVSSRNENQYTLADLVKRNNDTTIEFLKMDIEGSEHTVLIPFLKQYQVCQLLLEIHWNPTQHIQLLKEIASLNYALFSREPNLYCPSCCEYSFIHLDCMERYGASMLKLYIKDLEYPVL